jgi:hypothetical protein
MAKQIIYSDHSRQRSMHSDLREEDLQHESGPRCQIPFDAASLKMLISDILKKRRAIIPAEWRRRLL